MNSLYSGHSNRRYYAFCGLLVLSLFLMQVARSENTRALHMPEVIQHAQATPTLQRAPYAEQLPLFAREPLAFLKQVRAEYDTRVRDYECTFSKQEVIGSVLSAEQVSNVRFREGPFSVYMHIHTNPGKARRVLFVQDRIVRDSNQYAVIEPEGAAWRFLVRSVERRVDGKEALRASRKPITDFGFARSLDLIIRYAEMVPHPSGALHYLGEGLVDGRPTHVFERRLPYSPESDRYPDALLVVHLDQEWHVPVACTAYADHDKQQLLGTYRYTDVRFNVGLKHKDFLPEAYGL